MNFGGLAPADVLRILSRSSEFLPHFALVAGGPSSAVPMIALDLGPDRASWFPAVGREEAVEGRFVARITAHIGLDPTMAPAHSRLGARLMPAFRGWSTVVLTATRLAGICPRAEGLSGPVDFERGTVMAWSLPLRHVDSAAVVESGGGRVVAVRSTDRLVGGMTLEGLHRVVDGGLQPVAPEELAATLNTASRRHPDGTGAAAGPGDGSPPSPWS